MRLSWKFLVDWLIARGFPARQIVQCWLAATFASGTVLWAQPAVIAPSANGQQVPPSDSRAYSPPEIRRLPLVNSEVRVARAESQFLTYEQVRQLEKPSLVAPTDWSSDCQPRRVCFPQAPKPLDLAGHQVEIGVTGSVWFDGLHDFNALGVDPEEPVYRELVTSAIPVTGVATERDDRTGFSPNQTNFESWFQTPTELGQLRAYTKLNMGKYATSADFQVYKAFAEWGWLKAGLDFTLWLNQDAAPNNLDYEGPNAIPYVRYPQVRLKIPLEAFSLPEDHFVLLGMETPPADLTLPLAAGDSQTVRLLRLPPEYAVVLYRDGLGAGADDDPTKYSKDRYASDERLPTFIGKWIYEPDWAHIELAGLYRRIGAVGRPMGGGNYDSSVNGWGVALSGKIDTWGNDNVIVAGQIGEALGAYSQDTAGLGLDAAPIRYNDLTSPLKAIRAVGAWAAYEHWWTNVLRSTVTYGYLVFDSGFAQQENKVGTYLYSHYASANIIWSPIPSVDMGVAYLFGSRRITAESYEYLRGSTLPEPHFREANDHRLQVTIRWNFGYQSPKIK